jgi:hypothetical protein
MLVKTLNKISESIKEFNYEYGSILNAIGLIWIGVGSTIIVLQVEKLHRKKVCEQFPVIQLEKVKDCAEFVFED